MPVAALRTANIFLCASGLAVRTVSHIAGGPPTVGLNGSTPMNPASTM
jgi:hypothetical protein